MHRRIVMQRFSKITLGCVLLFVAACNANSDAVSVLQADNTSLHATIAFYEGMAPTMTAQASAANQKVATLQATLTAVLAANRDLMARLNASAPQPTAPPVAAVPAADNGTPDASAGNGFSFAEVVTAKGKDNSNCAVNRTSTFSVNDPRIYVMADVRNFKSGTSVAVKWSGADFSRDDSLSLEVSGKRACIYFYIEPQTLSLKPGDYTVTVSAAGVSSTPVQFTVQ
jgi:hypothetical protein